MANIVSEASSLNRISIKAAERKAIIRELFQQLFREPPADLRDLKAMGQSRMKDVSD